MDLQDRRTWQYRGRYMGQLIDNIKGQKQVTWGPDDKIIMRHFLAKGRLCAHDVEDLPLKDLAKSLNILSVDDEEITAVEWTTLVGLTPYAMDEICSASAAATASTPIFTMSADKRSWSRLENIGGLLNETVEEGGPSERRSQQDRFTSQDAPFCSA
ncbi:hypothetical protein K4K54_004037 [Colletotrichum sp. SAR 10_86]|nr:hypothetical protein K4K54_004037 [Colletotrichum sp. SAR 10_86]